MSRFEQFEVWVFNGGRWELSAWFPEFDLATEMARSRSGRRVRLIHAIFEDGKRVQEDVLADLGSTREHP